ncbi:C39 family peptidase [Methanolobus sediminis]|uniref:C39 family peptidase n=1 Tax=Methanolobus sediminis TaxID=3072978 RepID=A0AA51YKX6_9EURY|nr:C39 family peptidase [Methanolobus sediminis]WMW24389.1 C39 family peptidase [Methanolobus sediminis]
MIGSGDPHNTNSGGYTYASKALATLLSILILCTCNVASTEETGTYYGIENSPTSDTILDVPYYNQGNTNWCLYYCLTMMFNYNNQDIETWEIADYFNSGYYGTFSEQYDPSDRSLENYAKQACSLQIKRTIWGLTITDFDNETFDDLIKSNINNGQPVLMAFQYMNSDGEKEGHAILAAGYDDQFIYLTDSSGAITKGVFGSDNGYIAVPVSWEKFNEKLVNNISPSNMAYTIEIISEAPENPTEGSIYLTDRSDKGFSCLTFTNRYEDNDTGLLRFDGNYENGYCIVDSNDLSSTRKPQESDSMSVYFTVANPTSEEGKYTVTCQLEDAETNELIDGFNYKTSFDLAAYNTISKGVNYSNQLYSVDSDSCRVVISLFNEKMEEIDSIAIDLD